MSRTYLALIALAAASAEATNTAGDPTNLANWPLCAQKCIPIGLTGPPACGSLANLTCVCQNPAFALSIASCEQNLCNSTETDQIRQLSIALCAPVGGEAPAVLSTVASFFATETSASATSVTGSATPVSAVSSALATTTQSPALGNPANILTYPQCAQSCSNETAATGSDCDPNDISCACGSSFRSKTAACEKVTCSANGFDVTQTLAQQLCGSLYNATPSLASAVSSAVASATAAATAAVGSKDVTNIESYPACAQACISTSLPLSGCGSLSNRKCVCQTSNFVSNVRPCEAATCSASDLEVIAALGYVLCNPVGGLRNVSNGTFVSPGGTNSFANGTGPGSPPIPASYTGTAGHTLYAQLGWTVSTCVGILSALIFL